MRLLLSILIGISWLSQALGEVGTAQAVTELTALSSPSNLQGQAIAEANAQVAQALMILQSIPEMKKSLEDSVARFQVKDISALVAKIKFEDLGFNRWGEFRLKEMKVYLIPGLDLLQTMMALSHELTHAAYYESKMSKSKDFEEYATERLNRKGGEFEAYQMEARVIRALRELGYIGSGIYRIEKFFNDQGELADAEVFKHFLLDEQGYRVPLEKDFEKWTRYQEKLAASKSTMDVSHKGH